MDPPITPPDGDPEIPPVKLQIMLAAALSFPGRTLSSLRVHKRILGLIIVGGGSATGTVVSQTAAVQFSSAAIALIVIFAALRIMMRPSNLPPPTDGSFRTELDAHVTKRNDIGIFRDYRTLYSEAYRSWVS